MAVDPTPVYWNRILDELRSRLPTEQSFETWFQPVRARRVSDHSLELEVPSLFFAEWIQQHYLELLGEACYAVLASSPALQFIVEPELELVASPVSSVSVPAVSGAAAGGGATASTSPANGLAPRFASAIEAGSQDSGLNSRYTFGAFVVGESNRMCHAAALAVGEKPGVLYNPLVIYGGVGLGKTHLMLAIGHRIREDRPDAVIFYMSAEKFMNQMIASIQAGSTLAFREKYRKADLLLIDDVQFLATKDATQEEFFHTFNALYEEQKQIVLTSDKPPREIAGLEERLVSRFNQGLVTDVKPPELETRVAILQKRAAADRFYLPGEIALLIASHVKGNVRELEGCLLRLIAYTSIAGRSVPTMEMAQEILREYLVAQDLSIDPDSIANLVAQHYGITREQLRGKRRTNSVALPRQIAMYLMRRQTTLSLSEIGRFFDRDHTTVIHACDKIERLRGSDRPMRDTVEQLAERVQDGR
ncbi:MAG: chromosomal replication initiator protein DnaA [Candidatus Eiseniibacteriota bacterium]